MHINHFQHLKVQLEPLPFPNKTHLSPHISEETMTYHYDKHHQAYVTKTLSLMDNKGENLVSVIKKSREENQNVLYNNSAQVLNHHLFWLSLQNGITSLEKDFIQKYFPSMEVFREEFVQCGLNTFGSGWVWLLQDRNRVYITSSFNGNIPEEVLNGHCNIITICDIWEHAYYIDYRNNRKEFLETFVNHLMKFSISTHY